MINVHNELFCRLRDRVHPAPSDSRSHGVAVSLKVHLVAYIELFRFHLVLVDFRFTFLRPHPFLDGHEPRLRWEFALRLEVTQPTQIGSFGVSFAYGISPCFNWGFSRRIRLSNQIVIVFMNLRYRRVFLKWPERLKLILTSGCVCSQIGRWNY